MSGSKYIPRRVVRRKVYKIAMLSGGRDSTAMVVEMLNRGMPIDYIIFTDTQQEFPDMYEYLRDVDAYLQDKYGKYITYLTPKRTFEEWATGRISKGPRQGMVRGLPMLSVPCFWKRESKVRPFEKFIKDKGIDRYIQYIGYTYSESNRAKVVDSTQQFPLIDMKLCEADVDRILYEAGIVNPLYRHFERTGCAFCPYMNDRSYYILHKFYREKFDYMVDMETKLLQEDDCVNPQWHRYHPIADIVDRIHSGDFKYSDTPSSPCECQI